MDFIKSYEILAKKLQQNPNDTYSLCELIAIYPHANDAFDHEIINSIELFVDSLGHNQVTVNCLTQKITRSQNPQEMNMFKELLDGLFAIKITVLNELETYQNYEDIEKFFDFILMLKTSKRMELDFLVDLLMKLTGEMPEGLAYTILTDTLDYMVGWYSSSSILPNTSVANFIENLKKQC